MSGIYLYKIVKTEFFTRFPFENNVSISFCLDRTIDLSNV